MFGCISPSTGSSDEEFVGKWRIYSNTRYAGEGTSFSTPTTLLDMHQDKTWAFGDSRGAWEVKQIEADDWERWDTEPYGPTRKIVMHGWNGETWDGPVEESGGTVDFFWVIYQADTQSGLAIIQLKFGHSNYS